MSKAATKEDVPIFALALLTDTGYYIERSRSMPRRFNIRSADGALEAALVTRGQLGCECALIRKRLEPSPPIAVAG